MGGKQLNDEAVKRLRYLIESKIEDLYKVQDICKRKLIRHGQNILITDTAEELVQCIRTKNRFFYELESKRVVEISKLKIKEKNNEIILTGFKDISTARTVSIFE